MLLFGHRFIKSESFYHILDIDSIKKTPPSSTIYIEFDENNLDIIEYANENIIPFALSVKDVTELIYASALNAKYILVSKELVKTAQNIAENYLFDAKILVHINNENEIEDMALLGVDGVVFSSAIIKINS
jgi:hypothetical protein